ncbi:interleukin-18 receptor 1-like [Diadema antillarum]|uniref:interleukin-18 receptor 1-like n=1 Tax=Diadema antillarum TaxID=105358 RepID=UPI003A854880
MYSTTTGIAFHCRQLTKRIWSLITGKNDAMMEVLATFWLLVTVAASCCLAECPYQSAECNKDFPQLTCDASRFPEFCHSSYNAEVSVEVGGFLWLDCSANNFCAIEWRKEGILYRFNLTVDGSLLELELSECNQTLRFRQTWRDAAGNYTCTVSNGAQSVQRHFHVQVQEKPFTGNFIIPRTPNCTDKAVAPGQNVHFFCEFCAGDKARQSDVQWFFNESGTLVPIPELSMRSPENDYTNNYTTQLEYGHSCFTDNIGVQSVGIHLFIGNITEEALGKYVIAANYTLDGRIIANSTSVNLSFKPGPIISVRLTIAIVMSLVLVVALVATVTITCYMHHLTLQLWWKNRYGKLEENDGHRCDAFISYSDAADDLQFAIFLKTFLEGKNYTVWLKDIDAAVSNALITEEIDYMKQSRRCILIISKEYSNARHSRLLNELATDQILRREIKVIPILYGDVTQADLNTDQQLTRIVQLSPCIIWKEKPQGSNNAPQRMGGEGELRLGVEEEGGDRLEDHLVAEDAAMSRRQKKLQAKCEKKLLLQMPATRTENSRNRVV